MIVTTYPRTLHFKFCCVAGIGLLSLLYCMIAIYPHQTPGPESYPHQTVKTKPTRVEFGSELQNKHQILSLYRNVCQAHEADIQILQPKLQFKPLVLVITLNNPLYEILPLVELLYRPLFPEIVYCITNGDKSRELKDWNLKILYYETPLTVQSGIFNYICVEYVHQLGLKADGFIFMSDDVLVSPSAVAKFSRQPLPATAVCKHTHTSHECYQNMTNPPHYCKFKPRYLLNATLAFASLRHEQKLKPKDSVGPKCDRFLQNLTGSKNPVVHCLPDIFFLPSSLMEDASQLFRQFYNYKVFHGSAVYHAMLCLASPASPNAWNYVELHKYRMDITKTARHVVSGNKMVAHPVKLSPLLKRTTKYDQYFCKEVLPFLHNGK